MSGNVLFAAVFTIGSALLLIVSGSTLHAGDAPTAHFELLTALALAVLGLRELFSSRTVRSAGPSRSPLAQCCLPSPLRQLRLLLRLRRRRSEFFGPLGHELRTQLNGIMVATDLLVDSQVSGEQAAILHALRVAGDSLLSNVNDMLAFSKIVDGRLELQKLTFELRAFFASLERLVDVKLTGRGITLRVSIEDSVPNTLIGDPDRLTQVMMTLLANVAKYTPKHGAIELHVSTKGPVDRSVPLEFSIRGVSERTSSSPSVSNGAQKGDGEICGLDLEIAHYLIDLMGGVLLLEDGVHTGRSAEFTLALGVSETSMSGVETHVFEPEDEEEPLRVLLVEDNRVNQRFARLHLEKAGYLVVTAGSGEEALDRVTAEQFDVILMDIQMPGMNGIETFRRIRQLGSWGASVPVVAVTAHAIAGDREAFFRLGMDGYLPKPLDRVELYTTIEKLTRRASDPAACSLPYAELDGGTRKDVQ